MEIDTDYLRQHYGSMGTEKLIELRRAGNLTELALTVLDEILTARGITKDQLQELTRPLEDPDLEAQIEVAPKFTFFSAEGFAAGLMSLAAFQLYFLPLLQLGSHLGRRLTALVIGLFASVIMFAALRASSFLAVRIRNACPHNWSARLAGGAIVTYLLFFALSAWLIIGVMNLPYMGVAYSLGVFLFPIAIASFRGRWLAIVAVGMFVMGISMAHLPWNM